MGSLASEVVFIASSSSESLSFPFAAAAADHQTKNADALAKHGAAALIAEKDLIPEKLAALIQSLLDQKNQLLEMAAASRKLGKLDATAIIVDHAMELVS